MSAAHWKGLDATEYVTAGAVTRLVPGDDYVGERVQIRTDDSREEQVPLYEVRHAARPHLAPGVRVEVVTRTVRFPDGHALTGRLVRLVGAR